MTDTTRGPDLDPLARAASAAPGAMLEAVDARASRADGVVVFQRRSLFGLVVLVPLVTTLVLAYYQFFQDDPMLATGLGAVVVGFVVFLLFVRQVPEAFAMVRLRGLVPPASLDAYAAFEHEVTRSLNSRWAVVLAIAGAIAGFARYPVERGGIEPWIRSLQASSAVNLLDTAGETLIGAAAGLAIWRMLIVGIRVFQLGRFALRVQLGHPDRCGGFEPLGNLCLWNALILSVPGVFLGWWIIAGPSSQYGDTYVALHSALATAVIVLATLAFVVPLWGIHRAMARSAAGLRDAIERQGQRIDQLARELVAARDDLAQDEWEAKSADLERRKALYVANQHIPTWPIDVRLATKFGTSQLVPMLGVTGLSKPMVDVISGVTSLLSGNGSS
jgi:hypothetical protein